MVVLQDRKGWSIVAIWRIFPPPAHARFHQVPRPGWVSPSWFSDDGTDPQASTRADRRDSRCRRDGLSGHRDRLDLHARDVPLDPGVAPGALPAPGNAGIRVPPSRADHAAVVGAAISRHWRDLPGSPPGHLR